MPKLVDMFLDINEEWRSDPRVQSALSDFKRLIRRRYPEATFEVTYGGEPHGVYLTATVDLEDTGEVLDTIMDRLLEVQIDEYLPVYVIPARPEGSRYDPFSSVGQSG